MVFGVLLTRRETFGLTKLPASCVAPPLIADCFANLECKVTDIRLVNKYNLFILEVLKAWVDPAQKTRKPSTIAAMGRSRSTARLSSSNRGCAKTAHAQVAALSIARLGP
jgi:flavin reductase (DIM6/NTAB) family NADH-FMN oxidoreductase RutF